MKYRNWSIAIALALTIGTQAHAANTGNDAYDRSTQAGVCAVYQEATKASKDVTDATWKLAPEIGIARHAAESWQRGFNSANGTMRTSYLLEGERACEAIGARKGNN